VTRLKREIGLPRARFRPQTVSPVQAMLEGRLHVSRFFPRRASRRRRVAGFASNVIKIGDVGRIGEPFTRLRRNAASNTPQFGFFARCEEFIVGRKFRFLDKCVCSTDLARSALTGPENLLQRPDLRGLKVHQLQS